MITLPKTNKTWLFFSVVVITLFVLGGCSSPAENPVVPTEPIPTNTEIPPPQFDGERALLDVASQMEFGPRYMGSDGHEQVKQWIQDSLESAGWDFEVLDEEYHGVLVQNIAATRNESQPDAPSVLIGAHYDTRRYADRDPDPLLRLEPVPGANDGASGVAVLLELARVLPEDLNVNMTLAFFDAEDNGGIDNWDWIVGSRLYVDGLSDYPDKVIIVDMIGDADQNIYLEQSSDVFLAGELWNVAEQLGIDTFIFEQHYTIIDDHTPFLEQGISAVDIIDFDYAYWHTTHDTLDKVSAESLQNVGDVLLEWLIESIGV
jgi:hypothetical protein